MKLQDCIITGRFMGLDTVDECIDNYYLHYVQVLPFEEVDSDAQELEQEYRQFLNGDLKLDWDYINKEVKKLEKEADEYFEKQYNELKLDAYDL